MLLNPGESKGLKKVSFREENIAKEVAAGGETSTDQDDSDDYGPGSNVRSRVKAVVSLEPTLDDVSEDAEEQPHSTTISIPPPPEEEEEEEEEPPAPAPVVMIPVRQEYTVPQGMKPPQFGGSPVEVAKPVEAPKPIEEPPKPKPAPVVAQQPKPAPPKVVQPPPQQQRPVAQQTLQVPPSRPKPRPDSVEAIQDWSWLLGPAQTYNEKDLMATAYTSEQVAARKVIEVEKRRSSDLSGSQGARKDSKDGKKGGSFRSDHKKESDSIKKKMLANKKAAAKGDPVTPVIDVSDDEEYPGAD